MEPLLTALLTASAKSAIKSLANGDRIGAGDFAEVAGVMLDALAGMHDETSRTLTRIEAKLDRSLQQDFDRSFGMGLFLLRDATQARLSLDARLSAIDSARLRFLEGAAGTTSPAQQVQCLHAAAACSLLGGNPERAINESNSAWRIGYEASWNGAKTWEYPKLRGRERPGRLAQFLSGSVSHHVWEALDEIEADVLPMDLLLTDVQKMRRFLGVPVQEAPLPCYDRGIRLHFGSVREVLRPLLFIADLPRLEFPDGLSVTIDCDVRQPYMQVQFPNAPGAWVKAESIVDWPGGNRYERLRVHPAFNGSKGWVRSGTTSPIQVGPVGQRRMRIDVGCTKVDMLLVDVYSPQYEFTSLELARFENEVPRPAEDAPMVRIAFPPSTWSNSSAEGPGRPTL